MSYVSLTIAIGCEVVGTTLLQKSEQFTKLMPTLGTLVCYALAMYFLSLTLRVMPVGLAYAIWSGLGIVLISIIAFFAFKQSLDIPAIIGLILIIAGVVIINLFSKSIVHH